MRTDSAIRLDVEPDFSSDSTEHLLALRSSVDLDGAAADFDLHFTNQAPFRAHIPFDTMPLILTEIRRAAGLMLVRQQFQLDHGAEKLLELCETALRPAHLEVIIDPRNGDRLFIHQFDDHAPIAFRLSPVEVQANLGYIAGQMAKSLH